MQQFSEIKDDVADIKIKVNSVEDQNSRQIEHSVEKKIEDLGMVYISGVDQVPEIGCPQYGKLLAVCLHCPSS